MENEFPRLEQSTKGFIVRTGPKTSLPGYYIKLIYAEMALNRHKALARRARKNGGNKK